MNYLALDIKTYFLNGGQIGPSASKFQNLAGISDLVSLFLNIAFVLAGIILIFFFILGGIGMIGSAGKNDPKAAEQAKQTLTSALIGFIVVFASYWIVRLIGSLFGIQKII